MQKYYCERKIVTSRPLARYLLRKGYEIVDVRSNKFNIERTIFLFRLVDGLQTDIEEYETFETLENTPRCKI